VPQGFADAPVLPWQYLPIWRKKNIVRDILFWPGSVWEVGVAKIPAGFLTLALLVGVTGCDEQKAPATSEVRPVRTVVVNPTRVEDSRQAIGEIRPRQESDLGFRVSGKLVTRTVDVGAAVKKDKVLASLDDQDFQNKLQSAQADVRAAEAVLIEAQGAEERQRKLLISGVTTRANHETATKNLDSAQAKLESARVAASMANDQLGYTIMKADFDGVVTAVGAEAGQVVNVGQMIVRLAKPSERDAVFAVAESAFQSFKPDERPEVVVTLLSDPAVSATGVVREVSPVADPTTRTYQVKVTLDNPPEQMRFGASVSGKLKATREPVVVLPGSALFDKAGKPAVWVYNADTATVGLKPVAVGGYETDQVIVSTGLVQGDLVVTAGVNQLREGQKVRLIEESQP
jgi:RND family efflux transporter MFP subunit